MFSNNNECREPVGVLLRNGPGPWKGGVFASSNKAQVLTGGLKLREALNRVIMLFSDKLKGCGNLIMWDQKAAFLLLV